jgi:hypothetical protein
MSTSARRRLMRDFKVRTASLGKLGEIGLWFQFIPNWIWYRHLAGDTVTLGPPVSVPFVSEGPQKISIALAN